MSTSEDVFFYLDLSKDIIKKKEITKAIQFYIAEKNKSNIQGHYGLLIFQQQGNPVFITDKKDSNIILNAIEENWKNRPRKESYFENGLFYIFSFIAESVRKKSKLNRIIIITDTPSDLSEDYTEALFGLVSKIKSFPTFIDIVRVSEGKERFFIDDVKLNILANDTKGGIFYVQDKKEFLPLIKKLVKSKQLITTSEDLNQKIKINQEDYFFYSHLAKTLKPNPLNDVGLKCSLCEQEICPVCMEVTDKLYICENCGTLFHNCCVTNYTIQNNIGIPHIFRCPKCDILLQINQDEIVKPYGIETESVETYLEESKPIDMSPNINNTSVPEGRNEIASSLNEIHVSSLKIEEQQPTEKTVRLGGFFGKVYTVKKDGNKLVYQKVDPFYENKVPAKSEESEVIRGSEPQSVSKIWKPLGANNNPPGTKNKFLFTICPACGNQITAKDQALIKCPYCGYKL